MMMNVTLIGWVKKVESKGNHVSMRLSVSTGKDKEGKKEYTPTTVRVYGQSAEYVTKYVKEGDKVCVTGRGRPTVWTPREGPPVGCMDVNADNVVKVADADKPAGARAQAAEQAFNTDDLPF
jgi:single-stranded DNA-binding protein